MRETSSVLAQRGGAVSGEGKLRVDSDAGVVAADSGASTVTGEAVGLPGEGSAIDSHDGEGLCHRERWHRHAGGPRHEGDATGGGYGAIAITCAGPPSD